MKRVLLKIVGISLCFLFVCFGLNIDYNSLFDIPNLLYITTEDVNDFNQLGVFGSFINAELNENTMWKRSTVNQYNLEEEVEEKIEKEVLRDAIQELPEIQRRRLKKYFIDSKTYEQIAQEENCTKRAVKFSVDIAIEKISKKLKN